jgi:hypothetical protein
MNLPELHIGNEVTVPPSKKVFTILDIRPPEPHMSAIMVKIHEKGTSNPCYWISATWLASA